jgi:PTS system nitrogen regulatory IIA component
MDLATFLTRDRIDAGLRAADKLQVLHALARRAAVSTGLDTTMIEEALIARERLGSTGVGAGIALPHATIPGLTEFHGIFARLERPLDFDAIDGAPVDLVFLLLVPERAATNVKALSAVARRLRDRALADRLRRGEHAETLYRLLTAPGDG